jgi:hypothetical protein
MENRAGFAVNDQDFENRLRLRLRAAVLGDDLFRFAGVPCEEDADEWPAPKCSTGSEHSGHQPQPAFATPSDLSKDAGDFKRELC